jgi:hypothetical protein
VRYSDPVGRLIPAAPKSSERRRRWQDAAFAALDFEATGPRLHRGSDHLLRSRADRRRPGRDRRGRVRPRRSRSRDGFRGVGGCSWSATRRSPRSELGRGCSRGAPCSALPSLLDHLARARGGVVPGCALRTTPRRWLRRSVDVRWLVLALLGAEGVRLTLSEAADRFEVPVAAPHHAFDDALVTANLFLVTAAQLGSEGLRTARDALRIGRARGPSSRRPVLPR